MDFVLPEIWIDSDGDGLSDDFENQRYVYELIQGSFTWSQGREDAKERGGHLAIIESKFNPRGGIDG